MKESRKFIIIPAITIFYFVFNSFNFQYSVERISMDFIIKTLENGKSVSLKGELYYLNSGNKMITHFSYPMEQLVITNNLGQFKSYDIKNNVIIQDENKNYSSQLSYIYSFMSGKTQDMGLKALGYQQIDSKVDNKMIVSTWQPAEGMQGVSKVILVHQNRQPIYMCFYNEKQKPEQKVYYSEFKTIGNIAFPMVITEFQYLAKGDSVITKRVYSNLHLNNEVNETYINYKIPANAKVVEQK
jgi:hypothetical protein